MRLEHVGCMSLPVRASPEAQTSSQDRRRPRQALGVSLPRLARTVAHRRLAAAPLRIAWQIVEHLEPWELFVGMRVQ